MIRGGKHCTRVAFGGDGAHGGEIAGEHDAERKSNSSSDSDLILIRLPVNIHAFQTLTLGVVVVRDVNTIVSAVADCSIKDRCVLKKW